jgi:hypothetical protein
MLSRPFRFLDTLMRTSVERFPHSRLILIFESSIVCIACLKMMFFQSATRNGLVASNEVIEVDRCGLCGS